MRRAATEPEAFRRNRGPESIARPPHTGPVGTLLTFSNVISVLALMIALGGSAYAVSLGRDSIGHREIAAGAVRSGEVKNDALRPRDLGFSVLGADDVGFSSAVGTDPTALAQGQGFISLAKTQVERAGQYLVTGFADTDAGSCEEPVTLIFRVTLDGQSLKTYPEMTAILDPSANARAPIGIGGLIADHFYGSDPGGEHEIDFQASAVNGSGDDCTQVLGRSLNVVRLAE
jgi:hypothetical protein